MTSLNFFEQAIAAPSMKAALDTWGADSNLFHQGRRRKPTSRTSSPRPSRSRGVVLRTPRRSKEFRGIPGWLHLTMSTVLFRRKVRGTFEPTTAI
jgi:hypothetical protein